MVALTLDQLPTADRSVVQQIESALHSYGAQAFADVSVRSRFGIVTLRGRVPSFYAKSLVYQLVRRQPAVHDVIDSLEVVTDSSLKN